MTTGGVIYSDLASQGYFTQMYHNNQAFSFLSRNDYYSGTGSAAATSINFFCYDTAKVQQNPLIINPTSVNVSNALIADSLNARALNLNPGGYGSAILFPSSLPTTTTGTAGLGITWNDVTSLGGGGGRVNFLSY